MFLTSSRTFLSLSSAFDMFEPNLHSRKCHKKNFKKEVKTSQMSKSKF